MSIYQLKIQPTLSLGLFLNTFLCLTAIADLFHDLNTSTNRSQAVATIEQHFTTKPAKHIERWIRDYPTEFKALPNHSQLALLSRLNEKSIDAIANEHALETPVRKQAQAWSAIRSVRHFSKTEERFKQKMKLPTTAMLTAFFGAVLGSNATLMYTSWIAKNTATMEAPEHYIPHIMGFGMAFMGFPIFLGTAAILKARMTTKNNKIREQNKTKQNSMQILRRTIGRIRLWRKELEKKRFGRHRKVPKSEPILYPNPE